MSTSISARRRQVVISSAARSTSPSISLSVFAISDSGIPKRRRDASRYGSACSSTARTNGVSSAGSHISWSSRGGPGSTMTVGPEVGTTSPGAVPTGSIVVAPSGIIACFRFAARTASGSKRRRRAKPARMSAIFRSIDSSRTRGRPANRATTSAVRSSAVGPRPPLVTTRSTPVEARKRSAASRLSARSPTTTISETSTPSSPRRSEIQGPFRSETRPVSTSVPVTTIAARTEGINRSGTARPLVARPLDSAGIDLVRDRPRGGDALDLAVQRQVQGAAIGDIQSEVLRGVWALAAVQRRLWVDQHLAVATYQARLHWGVWIDRHADDLGGGGRGLIARASFAVALLVAVVSPLSLVVTTALVVSSGQAEDHEHRGERKGERGDDRETPAPRARLRPRAKALLQEGLAQRVELGVAVGLHLSVVLVDERLAVQPQVPCVCAQKAPRVGGGGKHLPLL